MSTVYSEHRRRFSIAVWHPSLAYWTQQCNRTRYDKRHLDSLDIDDTIFVAKLPRVRN